MLEVTKTFEKYDLSRNGITWVVFQFVILLQFLIGFVNIMIIKFIIIIITISSSNNTGFKYITLTQFYFVLFCFVFAFFLSFRTWQENKETTASFNLMSLLKLSPQSNISISLFLYSNAGEFNFLNKKID